MMVVQDVRLLRVDLERRAAHAVNWCADGVRAVLPPLILNHLMRSARCVVVGPAGLPEHIGAAHEPVAIEMIRPHVFVTEFDVPLGARRNLATLLRYELDRHVPLAIDRLAWSYRKVRENKEKHTLTVEIFCIRQEIVDQLLRRAQRDAVKIQRIFFKDSVGTDHNFCPSLHHGLDAVARALGMGVGFILSSAVCFSFWHGAIVARDAGLQQKITALQSQEKSADGLTRTLGELEKNIALLTMTRRTTATVRFLDLMADGFPDDVWLVTLEMAGTQMHAAGFARNAGSMVEALEKTDHFAGIKFNAPITKNQAGLERFDIQMTVKDQ